MTDIIDFRTRKVEREEPTGEQLLARGNHALRAVLSIVAEVHDSPAVRECLSEIAKMMVALFAAIEGCPIAKDMALSVIGVVNREKPEEWQAKFPPTVEGLRALAHHATGGKYKPN